MSHRLTASFTALAGPTSRRRLAELAIGILLVAVVAGGYWIKLRPAPEAATQEAAMKEGLDALYTRADPLAAVGHFRKVLELNPEHYGATFQIAKALDSAGRPAEALPYWEKARAMAEKQRDDETLATIRARLAKAGAPRPEPTPEASMSAGLDALYKKGDPATAAADFRKVLARNPTHYGAHYQLATALDRMGQRAEASKLWEAVARMAEEYKDQKTLDAAHARLGQKP